MSTIPMTMTSEVVFQVEAIRLRITLQVMPGEQHGETHAIHPTMA